MAPFRHYTAGFLFTQLCARYNNCPVVLAKYSFFAQVHFGYFLPKSTKGIFSAQIGKVQFFCPTGQSTAQLITAPCTSRFHARRDKTRSASGIYLRQNTAQVVTTPCTSRFHARRDKTRSASDIYLQQDQKLLENFWISNITFWI
jgi:hypothetical protein